MYVRPCFEPPLLTWLDSLRDRLEAGLDTYKIYLYAWLDSLRALARRESAQSTRRAGLSAQTPIFCFFFSVSPWNCSLSPTCSHTQCIKHHHQRRAHPLSPCLCNKRSIRTRTQSQCAWCAVTMLLMEHVLITAPAKAPHQRWTLLPQRHVRYRQPPPEERLEDILARILRVPNVR